MKLKKGIEVKEFLKVVDQTVGRVWLESDQRDKYNLKTTLSRYVAIAEMIKDCSDELSLYCDTLSDEQLFFDFFAKYPDTL